MGFFSQCEKKHNYFVHGLIRLQVQQTYAGIIELCLINTFLHAIFNSCMNGVTVVHACMHIGTWRSKSSTVPSTRFKHENLKAVR